MEVAEEQEVEQLEEVVEEVEQEAPDTPDDDEIVISIGDESLSSEEEESPEQAQSWVKDLRAKQKEQSKYIKELESKIKSEATPKVEPLGDKPTMESVDYDEAAYEAALSDWFGKKREADAKAEAEAGLAKQQQDAWQSKLDHYETSKSELKVKDFDEAAEVATSTLSQNQQAIIIEGSKNPALVAYVIGKDPARAEQLSKIASPVEFAFAVAKLETELKVSKRTSQAPPPEKALSGKRAAVSADSTLEKLREEAIRTGDNSKVVAYKRELKRKQ